MVARERLTRLELRHVPAAVLTAIVVASEQERVRHMAPKATRDVHEPREANDGGTRDAETFRPDDPIVISLDDLGLSIDHQPQRALQRNHGKWFKGSI